MALDEVRLRELPDDVIYRIITNHLRITNKAAIQLSLLSKELQSALQRRSVLVFQYWSNCCTQETEHLISTLTRYKNQNIHLDTFEVKCSFHADLMLLDQCIQLATAENLGLRNLNICMPDGIIYDISKHVFEAKSLAQLKLENGRLQSIIITWPNLKTLRLSYVYMEQAGVFEDVIIGCPLIEFLEIKFCSSINLSSFDFKVSNLDHLKKLDVRLFGNQTFELGAAPKLEFFTCYYGHLRFRDTYEYHKLKTMKLSGLNASFSGCDFFISLARRFPVLEELSISNINLEKIIISNPSLKKISLHNIRGLQEASFDVPNIDAFTFSNNVVPRLSFSGNSGGWISRITFWVSNCRMDTSWYLKLKEFLDAIKIPAVYFQVFLYKREMNFRILKFVDAPNFYRYFTMTKIELDEKFSLSFNIGILYDIIFDFCPERIYIQDLDWRDDCEFPKVLYDHLMLTRFHNTRFYSMKSSKRDVTRISMHGRWSEPVAGPGDWDKSLERHQVSDRKKFLKLFKADDDMDGKFSIMFNLEYSWSNTCFDFLVRRPLQCVKRWLFSCS